MVAHLASFPKMFAGFAIVVIALTVAAAHAFVITPDGENGLHVETPSALYASSTKGLTKVLETGKRVPAGGEIADLGNPALAPDGTLVFGALVNNAGKLEWRLLEVDPNSPPPVHLKEALSGATLTTQYRPVFPADPRVSIAGDGAIEFVASDQFGRAALFRFADNHLDCLLRSGAMTTGGRLITNLGYGSVQVSADGWAVLRATMATDSQAARKRETRNAILLVAPGQGVSEVAVEGENAPDNQRYGADFPARRPSRL
ncbi:MAG: hypothetical protein JO121_17985 [Deltaproteobacteria bacterium]|nr:hypothetical protein [Deltaproteobacteria bacterium]